MLNFLTWIGLGVFVVALAYDFWSEWLGPRLLWRPWFPGEPDLPPVAGEVDEEPDAAEKYRVILGAYFAGGGFLVIGLLDVAPVSPSCLPYSAVLKSYGVGFFSLVTVFMWFSEGNNVEMPFHGVVRYVIGVLVILIPLYMGACGAGVL